jgi:hypothetical protein
MVNNDYQAKFSRKLERREVSLLEKNYFIACLLLKWSKKGAPEGTLDSKS